MIKSGLDGISYTYMLIHGFATTEKALLELWLTTTLFWELGFERDFFEDLFPCDRSSYG
jgi:hypothetical protein